MNLREISLFLNFCILTPLFDTTLLFAIWFIVFLAVNLQKNETALWVKDAPFFFLRERFWHCQGG
jgi:hypothetical protein